MRRRCPGRPWRRGPASRPGRRRPWSAGCRCSAPSAGSWPPAARILPRLAAARVPRAAVAGGELAAAAGPRRRRLQLELGGKDPAYVPDEVDVPAAAAAVADGAFYNAGQSCCAVERVYVQRAVAPAFVKA